jgi:uncharacterized membrane protein
MTSTISKYSLTFILILALVNFTSCFDYNAVSEEKSSPTTFVYQCDGNYEFVARLEGDHAWLFLPDITLDLLKTPTASGRRFTHSTNTLSLMGTEAELIIGSTTYQKCKNNTAKAIWEHAKLDGADFRAIGNEPGWDLTIFSDRMVFNGNYGQTQYVFPSPKLETIKDIPVAHYKSKKIGHSITVTVKLASCRDSMSNDLFATHVTVSLDGKNYQGCGRSLH